MGIILIQWNWHSTPPWFTELLMPRVPNLFQLGYQRIANLYQEVPANVLMRSACAFHLSRNSSNESGKMSITKGSKE
jgi:hypothetical protein